MLAGGPGVKVGQAAIQVGLIGTGIGQSKSPALHMAEGAAHGLNYRYELIDLTERGLSPSAMSNLLVDAEWRGFVGLNITHPCKQLVIPLLDDLSDDARSLGAVNTVVFANGALSLACDLATQITPDPMTMGCSIDDTRWFRAGGQNFLAPSA